MWRKAAGESPGIQSPDTPSLSLPRTSRISSADIARIAPGRVRLAYADDLVDVQDRVGAHRPEVIGLLGRPEILDRLRARCAALSPVLVVITVVKDLGLQV
jgi:hypothetical protein